MIRFCNLILIISIFVISCQRQAACTHYDWWIDVMDHPFVGGVCVDGGNPLFLNIDYVDKIDVKCPTIKTSQRNSRIYSGNTHPRTTGNRLFGSSGLHPFSSTVSFTFTMEALCCTKNVGDCVNCNVPSRGAKNIWILKETFVTQKGSFGPFIVKYNKSDWKLKLKNCCS